ncbi:MAG: hypothetical protein LBI64_00975 [Coriobacteriales bacterium]|jgi:hypothetical protein|nr:hypothetical protein [Coriobacteriales bacterium]
METVQTEGSRTKEEADKKAIKEYEKYRTLQGKDYLSDFERLIDEAGSIVSDED